MLELGLIGSAIAFLASTTGAAHSRGAQCLYSYTGQPGLPAFRDYSAASLSAEPRPPRVETSEARRYRTAIKSGAAAGVNFAGRYTIVGWGCGASCLDWALVDRKTGAVRFDARYRIVSTAHVSDQAALALRVDQTFNGLRFRSDSTLLVLQGAPAEDEAREGLTFLQWTGRGFRQVAFVPAAKLCGDRQSDPP